MKWAATNKNRYNSSRRAGMELGVASKKPRTGKAEAGESSQGPVQPGLQSRTLSKTKTKESTQVHTQS